MNKLKYEMSNLRIFCREMAKTEDAAQLLGMLLGNARACRTSLDGKTIVSLLLPSWELSRAERALEELWCMNPMYFGSQDDQEYFKIDAFREQYIGIFQHDAETERTLQLLSDHKRDEALSAYCGWVLTGIPPYPRPGIMPLG